jgi:hypothetical protein
MSKTPEQIRRYYAAKKQQEIDGAAESARIRAVVAARAAGRLTISLAENPYDRPFVYTDDHRVHRADVSCPKARKTHITQYLTQESAVVVLNNRDGHGCGCLIASS